MSRVEELLKNMPNEYEKSVGYLTYELLKTVGISLDDIDRNVSNVLDAIDVDKLEGDTLGKFILQHKGIDRKLATYSVGVLEVVGTGLIAIGDLFETGNGVQFEATDDVEIVESGTVHIRAVVPGSNGNVGAGSINQMPVTLAGIVSCINNLPTAEGYDAELDDSLRERYYTALRTPATSGNVQHYKNWAMEVSGVGGARVHPLRQGDNTVDVVVIDNEKKPASEALVGEVQSHIDPNSEGKGLGTAPIGARCYVMSAVSKWINIEAVLSISTGHTSEVVEADIKAAIIKYLQSIAFIGTTVSYAQIGNQIIDVDGVLDYENLTVNGGTANIQVDTDEVAILETAVFSYA